MQKLKIKTVFLIKFSNLLVTSAFKEFFLNLFWFWQSAFLWKLLRASLMQCKQVMNKKLITERLLNLYVFVYEHPHLT